MPDPRATPDAATAPLSSSADVCHVLAQGERVEILFGVSGVDEQGQRTVGLQQRVLLGTAGAAQLQDLMTALLQSPATPPGRAG